MPTNDPSTSPLERMGSDLGRTFFHGARPEDVNKVARPAMVQTGQQIPVDLPPGNLTLAFTLNDKDSLIIVDNGQVNKTDQFMADAIKNAAYLSLAVDSGIPTWVFQQRQYGLANPPVKAESFFTATQTVAKLPSSVMQEAVNAIVDGNLVSSFVQLWSVDKITQTGSRIQLASWQPAIILRFPISQVVPTPVGLPDGSQVYSLGGTPEGDRWFLDQLGLLPGSPAPQPVSVASIAFAVETTDDKGVVTQKPVTDWSIARSNLSQESRPGTEQPSALESADIAPVTFPYIVLSSDDDDLNALRLLEMGSITNSGGYYFRATTPVANAMNLVLCVLLQPQANTDASQPDSGLLPLAANAIAVANGTAPDTVRFTGNQQIQIKPQSPIGTVSFGWTRQVPPVPPSDDNKYGEYRFGYGTISIVDYTAVDGAQQPVPCPVPVISPTNTQPGDRFGQPGTNQTSAMRLTPSGTAPAAPAAGDTEIHYYRAALTCYDKANNQSPWTRLKDPQQKKITVTPGFRDVYGNQFPIQGPAITRSMFYTDAIVSPADWPGLRFAVYPETQSGQAVLQVELIFSPGMTDDRIRRLGEISTQLKGVDGDVLVSFVADPLVTTAGDLNASAIATQIDGWVKGTITNLIMPLGSFPCTGAVNDLTLFNPRVRITRTKDEYLPADADLPATVWLAGLIKAEIAGAEFPIAIQAGAAPPAPPPPSKTERHDEYAAVAQLFQKVVAAGRDFQIGFLRDHLNQHEIWLIPNKLFPVAPPHGNASSTWQYATPCPMRNQPGSESYQTDPMKVNFTGVPDFTGAPGTGQKWIKYSLPLTSQSAIDQDFDDLGRIAFRMIEDHTADLSLLMLPANAATMRDLLSTRESIAKQLATFNSSTSGTTPGFVVPVLGGNSGNAFDPKAVTRIAKDSFLGDLSSFYSVSTVVQMPLAQPGDKTIQTFRGMIDTRLDPTQPPDPKGPSFSDVLLSGGDPNVTFLYDLAPGTTSASPLQAMNVAISHIQLPLPGAQPGDSPFNEGPWMTLATPFPLQWTPPQQQIPVVVREVPVNPVLKSAVTQLPSPGTPDPTDGSITVVNASNVGLLAQWGWCFVFDLVNCAQNQDRVHVTVTYPQSTLAASDLEFQDAPLDWAPTSLLQVLFVLKSLQDNWGNGAILTNRLPILTDLTKYLLQYLNPGPPHNPPAPAPTADSKDFLDVFAIDALVQGHRSDDDHLSVMKDINVTWGAPATGQTRIDEATVIARGESSLNNACVTGLHPLRSFNLGLVLTRNELFLGQAANDLVTYQRPSVQWPNGVPAQILWGSLKFDKQAQNLQQSLQTFFDGLLHGANPSNFNVEASISLVWRRRAMQSVTPFVLLPVDLLPTTSLANFVFTQCQTLLGTNAPALQEVDSSAIRLRVKITDKNSPPGLVLEIPSIDFPL